MEITKSVAYFCFMNKFCMREASASLMLVAEEWWDRLGIFNFWVIGWLIVLHHLEFGVRSLVAGRVSCFSILHVCVAGRNGVLCSLHAHAFWSVRLSFVQLGYPAHRQSTPQPLRFRSAKQPSSPVTQFRSMTPVCRTPRLQNLLTLYTWYKTENAYWNFHRTHVK